MLLNKLEVFNEISILTAAYHLGIFTEFVDDIEFQYQAGWSMIAITLVNISVNMGIMAYMTFGELKANISKLW